MKMSAPMKAAMVVAVIAIAYLSWFTINRALGVMVAAKAPNKELADIGVSLAPESAWTHFAAGVMLERTFLPEDLVRSKQEFEKAVALSPNDFRLWLELARSYEKNDEPAKAEEAFRRTLELAPNYSRVQWTVGNFLLRQDKNEEAFELIRRAASKDPALAASASAVALNLFDGDLPRVRGYFADSVNLRGGLAVFLASQNKIDDAVEVWTSLPKDAMSGPLAPLGEQLIKKLIDNRKYLSIIKMMAAQDLNPPSPGEVTNGSFEETIYQTGGGIFDWQFAGADGMQIGVDPSQTRDGKAETALALVFSSDGKAFGTVSQTVPVEPGRKYLLSFFYKSDLQYRYTMRWQVVNTVDSSVIASTEAISMKTDWVPVSMEFSVPDGVEGVTIRLVRVDCDSIICPIAGKVWFDGISIRGVGAN